jgi:glutathione synthase/RimK-type ligase-like ATP-grasp enzyme
MSGPTVLLTGAGGSASANVLDALRLSSRGYRVIGADASPAKLHLSQADRRAVIPPPSDAGYASALNSLIAEHDVDVVHPQPDPEVRAVGALRDSLDAATYLPAQDALELVADKSAFTTALARAGVSVPESHSVDSLDDAAGKVRDMLARHERVWVRARVGAGARASLPVRSAQQALAWMAWWIDEKGMSAADFMASEMLPGPEYAYQSVWQDGELVAGQARERVEYLYGHLTPSGQTSTPSVARTVHAPQVDELARSAVRAVDARPQGVYCVDIKENATGCPCVTEINAGRFFTTSNFFAHAGLNMPEMLIQCALGERPERRGSSPLAPDLYWIRMVDMGYVLVPGDELDNWPRPHH